MYPKIASALLWLLCWLYKRKSKFLENYLPAALPTQEEVALLGGVSVPPCCPAHVHTAAWRRLEGNSEQK